MEISSGNSFINVSIIVISDLYTFLIRVNPLLDEFIALDYHCIIVSERTRLRVSHEKIKETRADLDSRN